MKVVIVYDRVNKWGGAERVLLALHEIYPNAPLYTSLYSPVKAGWSKVFTKVIPSFLNKIPLLSTRHELVPYLMPLAFEAFNFDEYDLVITVTSEAAKGIITKPSTIHVCYCQTPTRYLWSHFDEYFDNVWFKIIAKPFVSYLKMWDKIASQRPDTMVAISTEVQNRIKKYYGRKAEVIHSPVDVRKFNKAFEDAKALKKNQNPYYLIVSRLVPYKKVDIAVKAFNELGKKLIVVGVGNEFKKLKNTAKSNITFTGFVTDKELANLYCGAKCVIHPQEEDFGIVPIEAQASGVPVIAFGKGGATDTVIDGTTGVFFDEQTKESLISAVERFEKMNFNKEVLIKNAERFSKERFKKKFSDLVTKLVEIQKSKQF